MAANTRQSDTHCLSAQKISDVEFGFQWNLKYGHFLTTRPIAVPLESRKFSTGANNELRWSIRMYPRGVNECNKDTASLYLYFAPSGTYTQVRVKFELSIFHDADNVLAVQEKTHTFVSETIDEISGFDHFIKHSDLRLFSEDSNFSIVCKIKDALGIFGTRLTECRFLDNHRTLFESKKRSDVTLMVGGRSIEAHRVFLEMHSPVFAAMFEHEMTERMRNEIEIPDIIPEVFEEMLRYMYTGEVRGIETIAYFLFVAADKYAVEGLKAMCEDALRKNIAVENAVDTLILADKYSVNRLKTSVLKFIASSTTSVMATSEFQTMIQSHPHLVAEALHQLALKGGQKPA